ncbi:MAG: succinate dehydrogenase cytochrome b subunit, partial [Planctomycetaceae bacterium]|nr:succinate dehydrogenase cytochrome b subunit [Planctomycetaceae bacterium]
MNRLMNALSSSVGRKYVMGLTGLFLCLFLVIHLAGNLLLYVGPEAYNHYAHALHEQQAFLLLSQILLYGAFLLHIALSFKLSVSNAAARSVSYETKTSKRTDRVIAQIVAPEVWMFRSGAIVLLFLIIHVTDFKFELGWDFKSALGWDIAATDGIEPSRYERAGVILRDLGRAVIYTLGSIVLGIHVSHGFASAFQSLGLNHPKYNGGIKRASVAFGWIVGVGFASFPVIWALSGVTSASSSAA